MASRIAIIGAGHSGVEAAAAAAAAGCETVLYSDEGVLPYYRPRVPAVAFSGFDPAAATMHDAAWYSSRRIELRLATPVRAIPAGALEVATAAGPEKFDAIILAHGSCAAPAPFKTAAASPVFPLWTVADALAVRNILAGKPSARLVLVGGGMIGIETALRAAERGAKVVIIEALGRLLAAHLSDRASGALHERLKRKGVEIIPGRKVLHVAASPGGASIALDDGSSLETDMIIPSAGVRRNLSLAAGAGLAVDWGIKVGADLATSRPGIFACGDIAQQDTAPRCSAAIAAAQGRCAGANAAAAVAGRPTSAFSPPVIPMSLSCCGFDIQIAGRRAGDGSEEQLLDGNDEVTYRGCAVRAGKITGVQMVGATRDFRKYMAMMEA